MVSFWSVTSGILCFSAAMFMICLLQNKTHILVQYGVDIMLIAILFTVARILMPYDNAAALIVHSNTLLPVIWSLFSLQILGGIRLWHLLVAVWLAGAVYFGVREAYRTYKMVRFLNLLSTGPTPAMRRVAAELGIPAERIVVSKVIAVPVSLGLIQPRIYMPDLPMPEETLRCILAHENYHLSHHDSWCKLLFLALRYILWWNPLVHGSQKGIDDMLEFRCDRGVVRRMSARERQTYLESLFYIANGAKEMPGKSPAAVSHFARKGSSDDVLFKRAMALERLDKQPAAAPWISFLVCLTLFVASYFVIWQPYNAPPEEDTTEQVFITPETSYILHTADGQYELWCEDTRIEEVSADRLDEMPLSSLEIREGSN